MMGTTEKARRKVLDFASRHASFNERNELIATALPVFPAWILDIGSNLGEVTNMLAERGNFVLGIESLQEEASVASSRAKPRAAFMRAPVTPELLRSCTRWDSILLLSVLHRIYAFNGEEYMRSVLAECGG